MSAATTQVQRTVIVHRVWQLGARSNFSVQTAAEFAREVGRMRRSARESGDLQGCGFEVATGDDARHLGAEDTVSGWYVRDLDVTITTRHP